jgi:uncharacterized membrane protein YphA (DoxX/SURF4 family)
MSNLIKPGRIFFALGIIGLGILQFLAKDFILTRSPSPTWASAIPGRLAWAYISGSLLIIAGFAVLFNIKARLAAFFLGALIFICAFLLRHLYEMTDWVNAYKSLALSGGAFIVAVSFAKKESTSNSDDFFTNNSLLLISCLFLSLFFINCGLAHFKFDDFVKDLVPIYMRARYFWTYFAAVALLATGIGLIFRQTRKWAAACAGLMIFLWFLMVHIPRAINTSPNASTPHYGEWIGVFESLAFSGILFLLAGMSSKGKQAII